ncbi:MAG: hypothetical protein V1817_04080 [Candidatus Micrarchaeota archaeon]
MAAEAQQPKINVLGVKHSVYEVDITRSAYGTEIYECDSAPSHELSKLTPHLNILKARKKVGVEALGIVARAYDIAKRVGKRMESGDHIFLRGVESALKLRKITAVPLDSADELRLLRIQNFATSVCNELKKNKQLDTYQNPKIDQELADEFLNKDPRFLVSNELFAPLHPKLKKQLRLVTQNSPEEKNEKIRFYEELCNAIIVERSLEMYRTALNSKTHQNIMGAKHAFDLKALGLANIEIVGSAKQLDTDEEIKNARARLEQHRKFKSLLTKLREIE